MIIRSYETDGQNVEEVGGRREKQRLTLKYILCVEPMALTKKFHHSNSPFGLPCYVSGLQPSQSERIENKKLSDW